MLHPCSCSQAALHHGGGLQRAHAECVSSHINAANSVNYVTSILLLHECSLILPLWQETAAWRQVHRSAVPPFSYFQAEVWQEVCAEIKELHEQPAAVQEIQWVIRWVSLTADSLFPLNPDCWLALSVLMWCFFRFDKWSISCISYKFWQVSCYFFYFFHCLFGKDLSLFSPLCVFIVTG